MPGGAGTQRLPRLVGKGRAMEMILTGEIIDAAEAYRIGLVNRVVPLAELMDHTKELAGKLTAKSPLALMLAKDTESIPEKVHGVGNRRLFNLKRGIFQLLPSIKPMS